MTTKNGKQLSVTFVKPTTKKGEHLISRYEHAKFDSIHKAYGRPSSAKVSAFNNILKEMSEVDGTGMRITGAGSDIFSCAYKVKDISGETYLIYHTPVNRFAILYK